MKSILLLLIPSFLVLFAGPVSAGTPEATPEQLRLFENRLRPLLADNCFSCHGPVKQKGGLRLDSAKGVQRGGDSEKSLVVKNEIGSSLLLKVVRKIEGVPRRRPVRPSRCRRDARDRGAPICATDITDPMSTPSSRVEVQTAVVGRLETLRRSSSSSRSVFDRLP